MRVDMPRVSVYLAAVCSGIDECLEFWVFVLGDAVEVYQLGIGVVDNLALGGFNGKEDSTASAERLGVESVLGDERQDMFKNRLFPSVVGYWRLVKRWHMLSDFEYNDY